jgi:hypothetical protein
VEKTRHCGGSEWEKLRICPLAMQDLFDLRKRVDAAWDILYAVLFRTISLSK